MRTLPRTLTLIALGLGAASCADAPTAPQVAEVPDAEFRVGQGDANKAEKAAERAALLTNVPVTGVLSDGGTFAGTFTAKRIDIDPDTRELSMTGILSGMATSITGVITQITGQSFTAPLDLSSGSTSTAAIGSPASLASGASVTCAQDVAYTSQVQLASCDVLFLDLGPLHLDLLGLTVDLAQVVLDINAVTGPGNLLGNLLCALLGLLDVTALLAAITQLLELINNILGGLSGAGVGSGAFFEPSMIDASTTFLTTT